MIQGAWLSLVKSSGPALHRGLQSTSLKFVEKVASAAVQSTLVSHPLIVLNMTYLKICHSQSIIEVNYTIILIIASNMQ